MTFLDMFVDVQGGDTLCSLGVYLHSLFSSIGLGLSVDRCLFCDKELPVGHS